MTSTVCKHLPRAYSSVDVARKMHVASCESLLWVGCLTISQEGWLFRSLMTYSDWVKWFCPGKVSLTGFETLTNNNKDQGLYDTSRQPSQMQEGILTSGYNYSPGLFHIGYIHPHSPLFISTPLNASPLKCRLTSTEVLTPCLQVQISGQNHHWSLGF